MAATRKRTRAREDAVARKRRIAKEKADAIAEEEARVKIEEEELENGGEEGDSKEVDREEEDNEDEDKEEEDKQEEDKEAQDQEDEGTDNNDRESEDGDSIKGEDASEIVADGADESGADGEAETEVEADVDIGSHEPLADGDTKETDDERTPVNDTVNGNNHSSPHDAKTTQVKSFLTAKVQIDELGLPKLGEVENEEPIEEEPSEEEEHKRLVTYTFDGRRYSYKEKPSVIEEKQGKIEFRVVNNDGKRDSLIILTGLKNIFQKQLPEMPKAYITRLVFDRSHVSIAVVRKPLTVVGGITIKPFESHQFAEIVFCAISSSEQVRGYGAHMMNHLKTYVRGTMDVKYFLTYADNYAIGYFKKQGFTKEITLPKKLWMGYIKDYEGGTLMQCTMLPKLRYLDGPKILSLQKAAILWKIRSIGHSHVIRPGLEHFKKEGAEPLDPLDIPGVKQAGWTKEMDDLAQQPKRSPHYAIMVTMLTELQNHPSNWPFLQPVNRDEVPDYYQVITEPMDLSTMEVKLDNNAYETFDDFIYDCKLIFNNCRQYNGENTTFYKNSNKLEKVLINKLKDFPEYSQYIDMLQQ